MIAARSDVRYNQVPSFFCNTQDGIFASSGNTTPTLQSSFFVATHFSSNSATISFILNSKSG